MSRSSLKDLKALTVERGKAYRFLATFYIKAPDQGLLNSLRELGVIKTFPRSFMSAFRAVQNLAESSEHFASSQTNSRLRAEFTRLFRGLRPQGPPPPYESVYREGVLFGACTNRVTNVYRRYKLAPAHLFQGEPPDHIAFELDFMRFLCEKEAEAWNIRDEREAIVLLNAEREFLEEHLLTWIGKLREKIKEHDSLGFYVNIADLTERWLELDYQHITGLREREFSSPIMLP